jgi:predicted AAA+ superfamily ATPase
LIRCVYCDTRNNLTFHSTSHRSHWITGKREVIDSSARPQDTPSLALAVWFCVWRYYMKVQLHMVHRRFWLNLLGRAWKERSVVWLAGVRRVGKTCLCQDLPKVEYFDCELPRVRRIMLDPESFLDGLRGKRIVLDEIHRLQNPSELLKIAADYHSRTHIVATGSSTLGASKKFRDTLAGRKRDLWLAPMCLLDMDDANRTDLKHRFLRGDFLPSFCLRNIRNATFKNGWTLIGLRISRNSFV